jgi:hypothetical protein
VVAAAGERKQRRDEEEAKAHGLLSHWKVWVGMCKVGAGVRGFCLLFADDDSL